METEVIIVNPTSKWVTAFIVALVFLFIASPYAFKLTNSVLIKLGIVVSDAEGCPSVLGLFIHALIFLLVIRLLMAFQ